MRASVRAPAAYQRTAQELDIAPGELCLVAAHHGDLFAARAAGLQTAFIHRLLEYGGVPAPDLQYQQPWDYEAGSLTELAGVLGGDGGAQMSKVYDETGRELYMGAGDREHD